MRTYLPFIKKIPVTRHYNKVLNLREEELIAPNLLKKTTPNAGVVTLYLLNNGYFYTEQTINSSFTNLKAHIYEVDYRFIQDRLQFDEENKTISYNYGTGVEVSPISTQALAVITQCLQGDNTQDSARILAREVDNTIDTNEGLLDNLNALNQTSDTAVLDKSTADSSTLIRLESYLTGGYVTQRVPMLIGPTAVAKSSTIKALAQKHNMRLVDFRVAFMSRLDIEGLTEIEHQDDGTVLSRQSPSDMLTKCTDGYIDYCKACVPEIETALTKETDPINVKKLESLLAKYKEESKIPILFLDEVSNDWPPYMGKAN